MARLELDLGVDAASQAVGAAAPDDVVVFALLVKSEERFVEVLALQTFEVPMIQLCEASAGFVLAGPTKARLEAYLGENEHDRAGLGDLKGELGVMVVNRPWHLEARPLLRHRPFRPENPGPNKALILAQQVLVRYPERLRPKRNQQLRQGGRSNEMVGQ